MTELHWKSAAELAAMYRSKETSPGEVVEAVIAQLERTEPVLNAFVTQTVEQARDAAQAATRRFATGEELPELFGVPITVKDLTDTAGVRTTYGTVAYAQNVPEEDAIAWARLKAEGVILLGKTTTPEFGLLGVTESKLTGTTNNPWDPSRTTGGSSGGAAAAVVAGVGPLAWGSDGGGSIRVPSSLCGAVGVKPSIGRIPLAHCTDGDATQGPITRSVLDAALMLDATVGHHHLDRFSLPRTGERYADIVRTARKDFTGLRIAAIADLGQQALHPETRRVFQEAIAAMREAGAVVEEAEVKLPDTTEFFVAHNAPEYTAYVDECLEAGASEADIWPMILDFASIGRQVPGTAVSKSFRDQKTEIYEAFLGALDGFDAIVSPTTPLPAFVHDGDYGPKGTIDGVSVPPWAQLLHAMTEPPSHAGIPAVTINGGFTAEGLPVGLQFMTRLLEDGMAMSIAARWEAVNASNGVRRPHIAAG